MPRAGIDWDTLHTLEERIAALVEDTDLTEYRLLINPSDEQETRRIIKKMKVDLKVSTNGAVAAGSPMLEGVPDKRPRTTMGGVAQEPYDPEVVAQRVWKAMQQEGKTYQDNKSTRLPRASWDELDPVDQHVFTGAIRRVMTERVIVSGSRPA
jgi:hypothetical protein